MLQPVTLKQQFYNKLVLNQDVILSMGTINFTACRFLYGRHDGRIARIIKISGLCSQNMLVAHLVSHCRVKMII
jgi:hypothetical protein